MSLRIVRTAASIIATVTLPGWWLRAVIAAKVRTVALLPSCREV